MSVKRGSTVYQHFVGYNVLLHIILNSGLVMVAGSVTFPKLAIEVSGIATIVTSRAHTTATYVCMCVECML